MRGVQAGNGVAPPPGWRIAAVYGEPARFCGKACHEEFAADRRLGVPHGRRPVGGVEMDIEPASVLGGFCAHCGRYA